MLNPTNSRPFSRLLTAAAMFGSLTAAAQQPRSAHPPTQIERRADGTPELVRFDDRATAPPAAEAPAAMREVLGLSAQNELRPSRPVETDELGFTHQKYQQFYQGVPVEHTAYTTHSRAGVVEYMTGETRPLADGALTVQPTLTASTALRAALAFVHADRYRWELPGEAAVARETEGKASFQPTGELVIVDNLLAMDLTRRGQSVLAWKFDIYAAQPVSRAWIYVDAQTGEIVNQDAIIKHANAMATFATRYSGTRQLPNEQHQANPVRYRLRDYTRGQGIETFNLLRQNNLGSAVDFVDADNNWTAAEYNNANQDRVAGDAHFGAQQTYDYWQAVHGRNSWNGTGGKLKSYVHFDNTPGDGLGLDDAFWNGAVMLYGDGNVAARPLTSLDVCGHEVGHGICQATAGLVYQDESGALNEGFSDIWGACVEQRAAALFNLPGKNTWLIGEEIMLAGGGLRSLINPKTYNDPDTYKGTNWYAGALDNGGVHTNSGVLNHWFYLLSHGGTGTNDNGSTYSITGIGIIGAAKIAYLTEKLLSPTSGFVSARTMAVQAAITLYGANSSQVRAVDNAWAAVGVGSGMAFGNSAVRYIDAVLLNGLARFSGNDGGYYSGVGSGATVPTLTRCSQQSLIHSGGFTTAATTQYWNAWVDFNRDGDFGDAGERVLNNKIISATGLIISPFTVPASAALGNTRMRVSMSAYMNSVSCGYVGPGEVEEYAVNLAASVAVGGVTSLNAVAITATSATLQWANVAGAASYNLQYRLNTSFVWTNTTSAGNSKPLIGLTPGRQYVFRVQAVNGCGTTGNYSASFTFNTPLVRPGAPSPTTDSLTAGATSARVTGLAGAASAALQAGAYPNPATDALHLTLRDDQQAEQVITTVDVRDARGAQVLSAPFDATTGTLRIAALTPGLYTATVRGGDRPATVRFVKQ